MRSSKDIIKSNAQKQWLNVVLDIDFMTLNILKLDLFLILIEFIIDLRAVLQKFVEKYQFNEILSYFLFKKWDNYLFNITYLHTTCTIF